ncbi:Retrovirus-related Pol polyprotein from transposon [Dictyocoela muelleri]|nr:Retrovirus-related Pol polyprotein from transposon [Dictyocoela muelleri]
MKQIEITTLKLATFLDWNDDMIKSKKEEVFLAGLDEVTRMEITRYSNRDFKQIVENLMNLEALLIEKFLRDCKEFNLKGTIDHCDTQSGTWEGRFKNSNNESRVAINYLKKNGKYCRFHKSNSHSTEECRMNRGKSQKKSNEKTFAIKEPMPEPATIEIPFSIHNIKFTALIDTGSVENYLPEHIARELKLEIRRKCPARKIEIADGTLIEVNLDTKAEFQLFGDERIKYISNFNLLKNPNGNPILGMRFLEENNAIINIKEKYITIDGIEYEFITKNNEDMDEKSVYEKSKVYEIKDTDELQALVAKNKKLNKNIDEVAITCHKIPLIKEFNAIPKEYPVPLNLKERVNEHLKALIADGIIEEGYSNCISPAFVLLKKNGKIRLVVDYRYLNSITKKTHQFIPQINEILAILKGSKIFSKIDLNQGYYHIKMHKNDIYKTGFRIMNKTFLFKRMPFGLCNAPATFQLTMNKVLKDVKNVHIYLNDILVYTSNMEEHIKTLSIIFERIRNNNMSINFEKSKFGVSEIDFLGHIINENGIRPDISNIMNMKLPDKMTKKRLERLLDLINWFRPYIRNLSADLSPFYIKLKQRKLEWSSEDTKNLPKFSIRYTKDLY